jgi:hypothetical protein
MTDNKCVANHKSSSWVMPAVGRLPPAASCLVYFQQEYNKSDMLQNRPSMPDTINLWFPILFYQAKTLIDQHMVIESCRRKCCCSPYRFRNLCMLDPAKKEVTAHQTQKLPAARWHAIV